MFKNIFRLTIIMMFTMFGLQSCDSDDTIVLDTRTLEYIKKIK